MDKQLEHEDGRALDFLLGGPDADPSAGSFVSGGKMSGQSFKSRLENVEAVLRLLSAMPAPEPSQDLLQKTLRRIEEIGASATVTRPASSQQAGGVSRPQA